MLLSAGESPYLAKAAAMFLFGDCIPVTSKACTARVARLQRPPEVAQILTTKFPGAAVLIARPARYASECACYDALLPNPLSSQGIPPGFDAAGYPAAHGLGPLLADAGLPVPCRALPPLVLLGFSKGAAVLHQVLAELAAWQEAAGAECRVCAWKQQQQAQVLQAAEAGACSKVLAPGQAVPIAPWQDLLASITELHWLDGGANSPGAAHPCHPAALMAALGRRCAEHAVFLHLHGTPRQWHDPRRRWLGREAAALAAAARAAGVQCTVQEYFADEPPSLEAHFRVIEAFCTSSSGNGSRGGSQAVQEYKPVQAGMGQ